MVTRNRIIKKDNVRFKKKFLKAGTKKKIFLALAVLAMPFIFYAVFSMGVARYGWDGGFSRLMARLLPLPAAIVNGDLVLYRDYKSDLILLEHYYDKQKELDGDFQIPGKEEARKVALGKQIRNKIIEQMAEEHGISVSNSEIEEEFDFIIGQAGGKDEVQRVLADLYGMDPNDFKKKALKLSLLSRKLEAFLEDAADNKQIKERAENVLEMAKETPSNFDEIAKSYSEGEEASRGGDLGYVKRGEVAPEIEAILFNLERGEVSDLVRTEEGWHILTVDDKIATDDGIYKVLARDILIRSKNLDKFIDEEMERARVWKLVKI